MTDELLKSSLQSAIRECSPYFWSVAVFSFGLNLLYLASPIYMLQVYNRVVTSGSSMTLLMLTIILVFSFAVLATLDVVRARVLTRAGIRLENRLSESLMEIAFSRHTAENRSRPIRDFDVLKQTLSGSAMFPLFDLPWTPIFVIAATLLHPWLGAFTFGCILVLALVALLNEGLLRGPINEATVATAGANGFAEMSLRHAETVIALGMSPGVIQRWRMDRLRQVEGQRRVSDRSGGMSSVSRSLRLIMQSLALGLGAWLVISHMSSAGVMFASSLLLSRSLQPVEQIIASWRSLVAARGAYGRLSALLEFQSKQRTKIALPAPSGHLVVENLHFTQPGLQRLVLRGVSFELEPGVALGVLGTSGAGKTTLARMLIGVLPASVGSVRLDGVVVSNWARESLGPHIGYLPQQVDLLADTIAANIGRFEPGADEDIVAAATLAGAHEAILQMPGGYDAVIGDGGISLPGGLRQSIGLARAVFRLPALSVFDEPATNLDAKGERALAVCIERLKQLGRTVIVVSPRQSTLAVIDRLMLLRNGHMEMFGDRDAVIGSLSSPQVAAAVGSASTRPLSKAANNV